MVGPLKGGLKIAGNEESNSLKVLSQVARLLHYVICTCTTYEGSPGEGAAAGSP